MKHLSACFLSVATLSLLFTACGSNNSSNVNQEEFESLKAENESLRAVVEEQTTAADSEISTTTEITTEITTTKIETTTIKQEKSVWQTEYFIDEWGDTDYDAPYLVTYTESGLFSNSVTVNSELKVETLVSDDYIGFVLYEYGYSDVVSSSGERYEITIVDENGEKSVLDGWIGEGSNQVCVFNSEYSDTKDYDLFKELLNKNNVLKIKMIEQGDYSNDEYSFKLDCTGFEKTYSEVF